MTEYPPHAPPVIVPKKISVPTVESLEKTFGSKHTDAEERDYFRTIQFSKLPPLTKQ